MANLKKTKRTTLRHIKERGSYLREDAYRLIDELKLGHIGLVLDGKPMVIPMTFWRVEDDLFFHCINKSRIQRSLEAGEEICISFAQCSEWVMGKSAFRHSANYRSVILFCRGERITDEQEFDAAFIALIDQLDEGRWEKIRAPNKKERKMTALMKLRIEEGSFKSRDIGPVEDPEDAAITAKMGCIPVCPAYMDYARNAVEGFR